MATEVIRYVNPDGTETADGLTRASGYRSLSAWETARNRDLTASDEIERVICCSDGTADTTSVTIDGWTTDATRYIQIEAEESHGGKWNDNVYRMVLSDGTLFAGGTDGLRIIGLQLSSAAITAEARIINFNTGMSDSSDVRVIGCILKGGGVSGSYNLTGIYVSAVDTKLTAYNNIIYDCVNGTGLSYGIYVAVQTPVADIYNNTIYNCGVGIQCGTNNAIAVNNLVASIATATYSYIGTFATGTDYNATDSTDAIGTGSNNRISQTFTFVDAGNDDFHLAGTDAGAKGYGRNLADVFTDDIDGNARPSIYTDDFNRADENPLTTDYWTKLPFASSVDLKVVSNQCQSTNATIDARAYYKNHSSVNQFGQFTKKAGTECYILLRATNSVAYAAIFASASVFLYKIGVGQVGSSVSTTVAVGAVCRAEITDYDVKFFVNGAFITKITDTGNSYAGPGSAGIGLNASSDIVDDFSCGEMWDIGADQYVSAAVPNTDITPQTMRAIG